MRGRAKQVFSNGRRRVVGPFGSAVGIPVRCPKTRRSGCRAVGPNRFRGVGFEEFRRAELLVPASAPVFAGCSRSRCSLTLLPAPVATRSVCSSSHVYGDERRTVTPIRRCPSPERCRFRLAALAQTRRRLHPVQSVGGVPERKRFFAKAAATSIRLLGEAPGADVRTKRDGPVR